MLTLPFFLIAHLLSFIFKFPLDGYSYFYQIFGGLSGLFYGFTGILVLRKILNRYFPEKVVIVSLLSIAFGTSFFHYATSNPLVSHSFSFFLFSVLVYYLPVFYENPRSLKKITIISLIFGMIILVRLVNAASIIIIILYGINNFKGLKARIIAIFKNFWFVLFFLFIVFLVFIPQMITWKLTFNQWIVYSYGNQSFNFSLPHIADTLFSVRRGLFFYSPVLIFSFLGIWKLKSKIPEYFLGLSMIIPIMILLNSSFGMWWFGASYGARAYIDLLPLLVLPMASFYFSMNSKRGIIILYIITAIFIISTVVRMYWYWTWELTMDNITMISYREIFNNFFN